MTNRLNLIILQISYLFIFLLTYSVKADIKSCTTQENLPGQCVLLEQCGPLLQMKNAKPYTKKEESYLRNAICDYQDEIYAKVCCPAKPEDRAFVAPKYGEIDVTGPTASKYLPDVDTCGPVSRDRIQGGNSTELGEYPWMALLEYQTPQGKRFSCGGALINNRYVLTAAHCVTGGKLPRGWSLISVRLGEYNLTTEEDCIDTPDGPLCSTAEDFKVEEQIVYEKYDSTTIAQYHDIALLRLERVATYSYFVKPICIPTTEDLLGRTYEDIQMTVAGWGATENNSQSDVMLQLKITVRSSIDCVSIYKSSLNIGVGQLCAGGEEGRDSCKGDSGGPLMVVDITSAVNYYVAGIVSFGPVNCGLDNWPGIYTRISKYVPWIVSKLKP